MYDQRQAGIFEIHAARTRLLLQVEEEQSQQRELALEKDKMATAFDNLKTLVEEDADTEAEYVKVIYCYSCTYRGVRFSV